MVRTLRMAPYRCGRQREKSGVINALSARLRGEREGTRRSGDGEGEGGRSPVRSVGSPTPPPVRGWGGGGGRARRGGGGGGGGGLAPRFGAWAPPPHPDPLRPRGRR